MSAPAAVETSACRPPIILPPENWADVFDFIPRRKLGTRICLVNSTFDAIIDRCLNQQCSAVILGKLWLLISKKKRYQHQQEEICLWNHWGEPVPLPAVPLPDNVVDFREIGIMRYQQEMGDQQQQALRTVQEMLTRLGPLLDNLNIRVAYNHGQPLLEILDWLLPVLGGRPVNSLGKVVDTDLLPMVNRLPTLFASLRLLQMQDEEAALDDSMREWLCGWLNDAQFAGQQPRTLLLTVSDVNAAELIWRLRQTFFATTNQPVPFFVRLHISSRALRQMPEFNTVSQNSEVISLRNLGSNRYMLARHPAEMGGTKLELEQQMSRVLEWEFGGQKRRNLVIHLGV